MTKKEIIQLLSIKNSSPEFFELLKKSNKYARETFNEKGYVFAQIGLNSMPCSAECKFCSFSKSHFSVTEKSEKSKEEVLTLAHRISKSKVSDFFLMTTADYSFDRFIEIAKEVKKVLRHDQNLIGNIGDFSIVEAKVLKDIGFYGMYHIVRLGEGKDTLLSKEKRISTIENIKKAGMELFYCVEPIGAEHSYDEIADEILRANEYDVNVMAVMKRVAVKGTPLFEKGTITNLELLKIACVAMIAVKPKKSMNVHEVNELSMMAGVNQLYAEFGSNPRDIEGKTEQNRGNGIEGCLSLLEEFGWK